nr:MAG TPA: hypothetical protein [Caudoviricetes sp.]
MARFCGFRGLPPNHACVTCVSLLKNVRISRTSLTDYIVRG